MKKNWFILALSLTLLVSLSACTTMGPGKKTRQDLPEPIANIEDIKAFIVVTEKGELQFYDARGNGMQPCVLPEPNMESKQTKGTGGLPICKGMTKDSAVTSVQALPILKSNSQTCMTFGPDAHGHFYEICW